MRRVWLLAIAACSSSASDKPAIQPEPVPAPPPVAAPAPREPQAAVAKDAEKPAPPRADPPTPTVGVLDTKNAAKIDEIIRRGGPSLDKFAGIGAGTGVGDASATGTTRGRISPATTSTADDATLTADVVLAKIQSRYMVGIKRCYTSALKTDPATKATGKLRFTVDKTGDTIKASAPGYPPALAACITALMSGWTFPIPKDNAGAPTTATFAIGLAVDPA